MLDTIKNEILQNIDKLDEPQLQILLGFIKNLLHIRD